MASVVENGLAEAEAALMMAFRSSWDMDGSSWTVDCSSCGCFFFFVFFFPSSLAMAAPFAISTGSNISLRTLTTEERTQSIPTRDDAEDSVCVVVVVVVDMLILVVECCAPNGCSDTNLRGRMGDITALSLLYEVTCRFEPL